MISSDVVSLFTSVPIDLALKVVRDRLEHDETLHERTYLNSNIISLLDLCLNATYLQFQCCLSASPWNSCGLSSVCHNRQSIDGRYRTKSSFNLQDSFTVLEKICWWYLHCYLAPHNWRVILTVSSNQSNLRMKLNWTINFHPSTFSSKDKMMVPYWPLFSGNQLTWIGVFTLTHTILSHTSNLFVVHTLFSRAESLSSCPSLKSIEELRVSKAIQNNGYPREIHSL